jgi:hypothetical protein
MEAPSVFPRIALIGHSQAENALYNSILSWGLAKAPHTDGNSKGVGGVRVETKGKSAQMEMCDERVAELAAL